jgi:hypothetical protein
MATRRLLACAIAALSPVLLTPTAHAVQIDYRAGIGVEYNDNVNLNDTDPVGATILEPELAFGIRQEGSTVQASAEGLVQYHDYLSGPYASEFRSQLASHLNWTMAPERLNLTIEDYLAVQPIDVLAADTPSNQQQTNVFAIGPTLGFRMGSTVRGQAELRYINSYADEDKEFNSNRVAGALRAIKDLDPSSAVSANLTDEHIAFTDSSATSPDYDRTSLFGRYSRKWTRFDMTFDLGYSWLNYSGHEADDRSSPLLHGTFGWKATDRGTLTLDFSHQYSDAASSMMVVSDIGATIPTSIATGDATVTSEAFLENRIGLGYAYQGVRAGFGVSPYYRKQEYVNADGLDQDARGATVTFSWRLRPTLTFGANGTGERTDYSGADVNDTTWTIDTFLTQQWTRNWSWRAQYTYYKRNSSLSGLDSEQNIVYFGVSYTR